MNIGKHIRELRQANQLTQSELARRAGLTTGFISLLERDKSSVSLETLVQVLNVFGESLTTFFSEDVQMPFVFKKKDRITLHDEGGEKHELLIPSSVTMEMESSLVELRPGKKIGPDSPHIGEEFGYVIQGRVLVTLGKRSATARAGECFSYLADKEHSIVNRGVSVAKILIVKWPPQLPRMGGV
ncbi:MAG: XRE family transcriptional regulator [Candidatus Eisenbacteria bacterium]